jgi:proline racemase
VYWRLRHGSIATSEIAPSITGSAYVTAQATLRLDPNDPSCWGIRQSIQK